MKTIVLDAGHFTNQNFSPVYPSYKEGNMTWELFGYLKSALEEYGFNVKGTRTNRDSDLGVYERGLLAAGADLFISLHSNACEAESIRRVVVIPPFVDRNECNELTRRLAETVTKCMSIGEQYQLYTRTYVDGYGRERDYYGVIRGAVEAGCKRSLIIEHSFHTNTASAKWLCESANLKALAKAEAKTIADYFGIEWTVNELKEIEQMKEQIAAANKQIEQMKEQIAVANKLNVQMKADIATIKQEIKEANNKINDHVKAFESYVKATHDSIVGITESLELFADSLDDIYIHEDDVPKWGRDTVSKLIKKGVLVGTGTADGKTVLNISASMLRILVINDRSGIYD